MYDHMWVIWEIIYASCDIHPGHTKDSINGGTRPVSTDWTFLFFFPSFQMLHQYPQSIFSSRVHQYYFSSSIRPTLQLPLAFCSHLSVIFHYLQHFTIIHNLESHLSWDFLYTSITSLFLLLWNPLGLFHFFSPFSKNQTTSFELHSLLEVRVYRQLRL